MAAYGYLNCHQFPSSMSCSLPKQQVQRRTQRHRSAQQQPPVDLSPIDPPQQQTRRTYAKSHSQDDSSQRPGEEEKQAYQPPAAALRRKRRQCHGCTGDHLTHRMCQPAKSRQKHKRRVQTAPGGTQQQPYPPQRNTRQPRRCQQKQIIHCQVQQKNAVDINAQQPPPSPL